MALKRSSMSALTEEQIQGHQQVIFHGLTRATWEELQEFGNMNVRTQRMLRATNPDIECAVSYETAEQKDAVRELLKSMSALLPEESFSYSFTDPLQPGKAVLSLRRSHVDYFNDIRANCLDDQLDALFLRVRDELKNPAFENFIQLSHRNERERLEMVSMRHDLLDAINLYHADTIPMPKSDIVSRAVKLKDAIERRDDGDLSGPMWVVEYNIAMGKYDRKEAGDALKAAQAFERSAQMVEATAKALKELGAGAWRE